MADNESVRFPMVEFPASLPPVSLQDAAESRDLPVLCAFPARLDPISTYVEARLRLQKYPHTVRYTVNGDLSPSGSLPALLLPDKTLSGSAILDELSNTPEDRLMSTLNETTNPDWPEAYALAQLIRRLGAAVAYHFFMISTNFAAVVEPLYCREASSAIGMLLARQARSEIKEQFSFPGDSLAKDNVFADAKTVMNSLSNRLAAGPFLFGSR